MSLVFCAVAFGAVHAAEPEPQASASLRITSRIVTKDMPGLYEAAYAQRTGVRLLRSGMLSEDNGRTWARYTPSPDFAAGLPYGYRREPVTSALDYATGRLITIINAMDTPGLDPNAIEPPVAQQTYYLRYGVSADGGRTWLFDEPIVQAGDFTAQHPFDGIRIGKNAIYLGDCGCIPIITRTGRVLVPAQMTPIGPDGELWNPMGALTYTDVLVLIGEWMPTGRLKWRASQRVQGDPARSTRGMIEPTLAQFADGRILMVLRGSNAGNKAPNYELPSYRWFSVSADDGATWSTPEPWTYDDGTPFFSPSSMSVLFTHSTGRVFWVGNVSASNCRGNSPRWPVVMGEVDPRSLRLMRDSVLVVDTEQPEDKPQGRLDLCHFSLLEDRETGEIVLTYPRSHNAYKSREWTTVRLAEAQV